MRGDKEADYVPELPSEAHAATGSRLQSVIRDLVYQAEREVESWLDACDALCDTTRKEDSEVLMSLARKRGNTIAYDLTRLNRLVDAFASVESRIRSLRGLYRQCVKTRETAGRRARRQAMKDVDEISVKLLDAERKRGDLFGDAVRISMRAQSGAKELYSQISALSGHGRLDRVAGFSELSHTRDQGSLDHSSGVDDVGMGPHRAVNEPTGIWQKGEVNHG